MSTSDEKKAPPSMARLQKGYCIERLKCWKAISGMDGIGWDWMEISVGTDSKSTALRC